MEFGKITHNKGYYTVQGHSRSPMSVPIESPYATSYEMMIIMITLWLNPRTTGGTDGLKWRHYKGRARHKY